jgi:hypothetical protein
VAIVWKFSVSSVSVCQWWLGFRKRAVSVGIKAGKPLPQWRRWSGSASRESPAEGLERRAVSRRMAEAEMLSHAPDVLV